MAEVDESAGFREECLHEFGKENFRELLKEKIMSDVFSIGLVIAPFLF